MNRKMTLLAVVVAAMMMLSACGAPASVTSSDAAQEETQPPASTPVPQSPSNEEKQAGNINDNFSYEYYFTPYDSTNETYLDERYYTVVATNNNDIEVKGNFKVFLAPKGETPDTSELTTKSSSNFLMRPGDKVMISGFCSNGSSLDYDFEEITVVPNMEPRSEEEIKEEPLSIMDDITFDYQKGEIKKKPSNELWQGQMIKIITANPIYTGHMAQGKTKKALCDGLPTTHIPRTAWIVVPNTHEAIVDEATFQQIWEQKEAIRQRAAALRGKYAKHGVKENIFAGFLFCGDCFSLLC